MKKLSYIIVILLFFATSCKKDLPNVGSTAAQSMSNEWWVTLTLNGADVYKLGHRKLSTYNTASNNNNIWVDDLKNTYGFKVKVNADLKSLSFSGTKSTNLYYDPNHPANFPNTVDIIEGKILLSQGHSKSGNIVDSIYMKVVFSDDPTNTYAVSGHSRTGFVEDEY